jgi:hypothetical protein
MPYTIHLTRAQHSLRAGAFAMALAALVGLPAASVDAQWATPRGWHRLSVGAGPAQAESALLPSSRNGFAAMAAFELLAKEHVELRFSGTLFEGSGDVSTQLGGAALDAVVFPWRGRVQPYVGAGAGVYQLTLDDTDPLAADPTRDHKGVAWTALVGTRVRVGALTPFIEWRRTSFASGAPMRHYAPLLAGLHF